MEKRIAYLKSFVKEFDYPEEAQNHLIAVASAIYEHSEAASLLEDVLRVYESDLWFDYGNFRKPLPKIVELTSQREESVCLVFVILLSEHMKELYIKRNIDLSIYHDSCLDFKAKLHECYNDRGVWGTFVIDWFGRFFNLTRFALGRLQFEINVCQQDCEGKYKALHVGDRFVGIHIPSIGPLKQEDCIASFQKASEFFAPRLQRRHYTFPHRLVADWSRASRNAEA